jgi:esterase/lipase
MTEGTMFLSGVDLDIHFGPPIRMDEFLSTTTVQKEHRKPVGTEPRFSEDLAREMRDHAQEIMLQYMTAIYNMTTVNHDHLFASFLERYPLKKMSEIELRRRVYLVARKITEKNSVNCNFHHSLKEDQVHLLTDDRFQKVENFLTLAQETNVISMADGILIKKERNIPDLVQFHRERIDNPIDVMVNEVEPLKYVQKLIRSVAWQPNFIIRRRVLRAIIKDDQDSYLHECQKCKDSALQSGGPSLLPGSTRKIGVVLVHSYLAIPEEMMTLARYLNGKGLWVYITRLAGHGTTPEDLADKTYTDWQYSVERGYAILSTICKNIVIGGMSIGGCLALDLASRLPRLSGVFALCPPLRLKDYSTNFMPAQDVWHRILGKLKRDKLDVEFLKFSSENKFINYDRNPVIGIKNVGNFLEHMQGQLGKIGHPSLIIHAEHDPIVDSRGSRAMYKEIGSTKKEYILLASKRHIITNGEGSRRVHTIITNFIDDTIN